MIEVLDRWYREGGHGIRWQADVADGHLVCVQTWQHIVLASGRVAGAAEAGRVMFLNGAMVRDPELSRRLFDEVMR